MKYVDLFPSSEEYSDYEVLYEDENRKNPFTGTSEDFYIKSIHGSGQLRDRFNYKNGKLEGLWEWLESNGQIRVKGNYKDGKLEGPYEVFHENGQLSFFGYFSKGFKDGLCEYFDENGKCKTRIIFKNGKRVK